MIKSIPTNKKIEEVSGIRNREGIIIPFEVEKIKNAVLKAFNVTKEGGEKEAKAVADKIIKELSVLRMVSQNPDFTPTVELVQDLVEQELISQNFPQTAKSYILYRNKRAEVRNEVGLVPEHIQKLAEESKKYFRNTLAELVYYRTYSRWIEEESRRETWIETIDRYMGFMREHAGDKLSEKDYQELREAILKQEIMPSMRLVQFAGPAAKSTNVCAYNCSFIAPSSFQDFAEIVYISMCGTGVGFSVESHNIQALPQIKNQTGKKLPVYEINDSKEGWADALAFGMKTWFEGNDVEFDYSSLRPAGARLKTFGGKSSGPEPLKDLLNFTRERILRKQGRRLSNLDAHDIICKIGECVVSGGVRRSALISLSDLDDGDLRDSKSGQFYINEPQRSLANNSAVYNDKPTATEFMDEWIALMKSGSGERGIFNRGSLLKTLPTRRVDLLDNDGYVENNRIVKPIGTNPCGEIILRSKQFCNLSEVISRAEDTEETLMNKTRLATILGTFQSSLTYFPYLSKEWTENCEKERLLGVSVTGQWDSKAARDGAILKKLKDESIRVNEIYAQKFGIPQSTCITCVKPSGTVSQVVDSASGMHPRHSQYYIRRIRISSTDALFKMLKDQGVPYHPEVGQLVESAHTFVLEFPVKAPDNAIFKDDLTALDQLEHWKNVKLNFTEHNPSVTISVGEDEWIGVANWLYQNWSIIGGLSFLPRSEHVYQLAPYEPIDEKKYEELCKKVANIDFSKIVTYERQDETEVKKELACVAGLCEI